MSEYYEYCVMKWDLDKAVPRLNRLAKDEGWRLVSVQKLDPEKYGDHCRGFVLERKRAQ